MRSGLKPPPQTNAFFDLLPDCLPDSFRTLPDTRPKTPNLQGFRIASGRFRMAWGLLKDLKNVMWRAPQKIKERRKTQRETSRLQQNPRKFTAQWCMKLSNQLRRKPFPACFPGSGVAKASSGATKAAKAVKATKNPKSGNKHQASNQKMLKSASGWLPDGFRT